MLKRKAYNELLVCKKEQLLSEIIDSKTVLVYYNATDPNASLSQTKNLDVLNYIYLMYVY